MKRTSWFAALLLVCATTRAATIRNNDSCDIAPMPAATLLLPYFEVDFLSPATSARTTIFTIINTSKSPQIARVTLWTDWAFPALTFNVFLTGYDVQPINLYDILGPRGAIALQDRNTGSASLADDANPLFLPSAASACTNLPGAIPPGLLLDVRTALTVGTTSSCKGTRVGGTHAFAAGYATIDLVATCGTSLPTESAYYDELLYDNVLIGDSEIVNPNEATGNYAGGSPLVHIRAVPEGGPAAVVAETNLPFTFYDHYAKTDRRQPLPSTFAARFIQGGTGAFNTSFQIWREAVTTGGATCSSYAANNGSAMAIRDVVRFDEHENPTTLYGTVLISAYVPTISLLPPASSTSTSAYLFPYMSSDAGDVAGWMYLNLTNFSAILAPRPSQNWIVVDMQAEGRYQTIFDGTPLGNGCSPVSPVTTVNGPSIAPAP